MPYFNAQLEHGLAAALLPFCSHGHSERAWPRGCRAGVPECSLPPPGGVAFRIWLLRGAPTE